MKNFAIIVLAACLAGASSAQPVHLNKGLIAYYPFDGDASDRRGVHHGEVFGAEISEERCGDKAYFFDGDDDYIDCGNHAALNQNFSGLTISAWIKPKNILANEFGTIVGKWGFDPQKDHFGLWINENYKVVMAVGDPRKMEEGLFSGSMLYPETWFHVVGVWKRSREMEIYVNGRIDNRGMQTGAGINVNSKMTLKIGRQVERKSRPFRGYIDEVRLYNRALNANEIAALYKMGKADCEKIILQGHVYNKRTMEPVASEVIFEDLSSAEELRRTKTEGDECFYQIQLPMDYNLGFYANAEGYIPINENINTGKYPVNQVINKDLYVVPVEIGESLTLNNIFFDFDKASLRKESFSELNRLLQLFNDYPNIEIEIAGHTDSKGSDDYNQRLSQERAESVKQYLDSKIRSQHIKIRARGYGESEPVATNETDEGRQLNRRVEFKILNK